jgi:hypothetical protein
MKIVKPTFVQMTSSIKIEVDDFDKSMNILDPVIMESFRNERIGSETKYLTNPTLTTATIIGMFANVQMQESDWVLVLPVCKNILMLRCNFGVVTYPNYTPPTIKKKKNNKNEISNRKKQGTRV